MSEYVYDLTVYNGSGNELDAFEKTLKDMELSSCIVRVNENSSVFSSIGKISATGTVPFLDEDMLKRDLHTLAQAFPNLMLNMSVSDFDEPHKCFEMVFHGDTYARSDGHFEMRQTCPTVPFAEAEDRKKLEAMRAVQVERTIKNLCDNMDFDLLYGLKNAVLEARDLSRPVTQPVTDNLVAVLDNLCNLGEALGRFQFLDTKPPFPLRPDYEKREVIFAPEEEPKMYVLCEELEGSNAIREFTILAMSRDEDELRKLLQAKVEQDPYGIIGLNGENDSGDNHFCSNFEEGTGFVEYYIVEESVLNKEQIQTLLNSPEYDPSFHCPDNLRDLLTDTIQSFVTKRDIAGVDIEKVADYFMSNKRFQAIVKDEYWSSSDHISEGSESRPRLVLHSILDDALEDNPDFFEELGAIHIPQYPNNLKDILIDNIYEVSRELKLPVSNADEKADKLMRGAAFTEQFRHLDGVSHLDENSEAYQEAQCGCYDFMSDLLRPKNKEYKPLAEQLSEAQSQCAGNTQSRAGKTPDIDRE